MGNQDIEVEQVYIEALEKANMCLLEMENSTTYSKGVVIEKSMSAIKRLEIKKIYGFLKMRSSKKRIARISNIHNDTHFYYTGLPVDEEGYVYSCITGGYDCIPDPILTKSNYDFILYTDSVPSTDKKWTYRDLKDVPKEYKGYLVNRYCKMHPFELFSDSDRSFALYIDGNIQIMSEVSSLYECARNSKAGLAMHRHWARDCAYLEAQSCIYHGKGRPDKIREQMNKYKKEGFPEHYGLCEASIIMVDLKNETARRIMNEWWNELIATKSGRDQIALPYVLWKLGIKTSEIGNLGNNLFMNPKFRNVNAGKHN